MPHCLSGGYQPFLYLNIEYNIALQTMKKAFREFYHCFLGRIRYNEEKKEQKNRKNRRRKRIEEETDEGT